MQNNLSPLEIESITRAAHEVNRSWQLLRQEKVDPVWEQLSAEERQIAKTSVINIVTNDHDAQQNHDSWVSYKKSQGWTVGSVKHAETKTHPCLVMWSQLPLDQQVKDRLWVDTVKSFTKHLWTIERQ